MPIVGTERNFASLAITDLLEARDLYHWHLTDKQNVVGTAVGLYYIRTADPWPSRDVSYASLKAEKVRKSPRTFKNSEIRDYSWPCVLVVVDRWIDEDRFGPGQDQFSPEELVPKTLYMPDGRTVPVCVVQVDPAEPAHDLLPGWVWPDSTIGGGFPIISETQGERHVASVGTLVTDGHTVYALTSRHVSGAAGHPISTLIRGREVEVGRSTSHALTRVPFERVYADFISKRTYLTLDAGLVEVDRVADWTSQTYGLPPVGELADLNEHNLGTHLINGEVVAFGAASGLLRGRIAALFFRYRSVGGYDDVTDFLIAPGTRGSQPGDSGTVWHLRQSGDPEQLRPIALQWGGQNLTSRGGSNFNFALAASLTNVLRLLNVDLVVDHNIHAQPFWGKTGHYTIASLACDQVTAPKLKTLMAANTDRISYTLAGLDPDKIDTATTGLRQHPGFIPLADVPDLVWKNLPHTIPGGRDTAFRSGPEHPTHFADIDQPRPSDGRTLREVCIADPTQISVDAWQAYYTALGHTASASRGLLPLRVWQFYDAMVHALTAHDLPRFVCAAGLVAHYVGDASQPLHGSSMADGTKATPGHPAVGEGVHSAYESAMIDTFTDELLHGLQHTLTQKVARPRIKTGHDAAVAIVQLMDRTAHNVPVTDLISVFAHTQIGKTTKGPAVNKTVLTQLWQAVGQGTITNMADGIRTLGTIWDAAFTAGQGPHLTPNELTAIPTDQLRTLYEDPTFIPSLDLDHINTALNQP